MARWRDRSDVCVSCTSVYHTITAEQNDPWPRYLTFWCILTLLTSSLKFNIIGQSSRSHDETTATALASAVHCLGYIPVHAQLRMVNVYAAGDLWRSIIHISRPKCALPIFKRCAKTAVARQRVGCSTQKKFGWPTVRCMFTLHCVRFPGTVH